MCIFFYVHPTIGGQVRLISKCKGVQVGVRVGWSGSWCPQKLKRFLLLIFSVHDQFITLKVDLSRSVDDIGLIKIPH